MCLNGDLDIATMVQQLEQTRVWVPAAVLGLRAAGPVCLGASTWGHPSE